MVATGYAKLAGAIKDVAHGWLLGKKRKCTGSDRPDAKRISWTVLSRRAGLAAERAAARAQAARVERRNGDGRGPASGKKKNASGGK
jgi:hypothetical protein